MISSISCTMFGLMLAGSSSEISRGSPIASYCCWSPLIEPADSWSRCCAGGRLGENYVPMLASDNEPMAAVANIAARTRCSVRHYSRAIGAAVLPHVFGPWH